MGINTPGQKKNVALSLLTNCVYRSSPPQCYYEPQRKKVQVSEVQTIKLSIFNIAVFHLKTSVLTPWSRPWEITAFDSSCHFPGFLVLLDTALLCSVPTGNPSNRWVLEVISHVYSILFRDASHERLLWLDHLLCLEAIEPIPLHLWGKGFYSRYLLIPEKTGDWRPLLDLRALNKYIKAQKVKMCHISGDYSMFGTGRFVLGPQVSGHLFPHIDPAILQTIPPIYSGSGSVPVQRTPFWPLVGSQSIFQGPLHSGSPPAYSGDHDLPSLRQLSPSKKPYRPPMELWTYSRNWAYEWTSKNWL